MRLRPFTPKGPIEDINEDPSQNIEEPDALNEQDLFDNNIPPPVIEQPQQAFPDQSEFKELRADHGIICYERHNIEPDNSILESQAETREQHLDNTSVTSPETQTNEYPANEHPSVPSQNSMSRYGLRHNPNPSMYPDFLVHELHGTPALGQLLLKNRTL